MSSIQIETLDESIEAILHRIQFESFIKNNNIHKIKLPHGVTNWNDWRYKFGFLQDPQWPFHDRNNAELEPSEQEFIWALRADNLNDIRDEYTSLIHQHLDNEGLHLYDIYRKFEKQIDDFMSVYMAKYKNLSKNTHQRLEAAALYQFIENVRKPTYMRYVRGKVYSNTINLVIEALTERNNVEEINKFISLQKTMQAKGSKGLIQTIFQKDKLKITGEKGTTLPYNILKDLDRATLQRLAIATYDNNELLALLSGLIRKAVTKYDNVDYDYDMLTTGKNGATLENKFSQMEFEGKFDFMEGGHCAAYSLLYLCYGVMHGKPGVKNLFNELKKAAMLFESRYVCKSDPRLKQEVDKMRWVVDGLYSEFYPTGKLKKLIEKEDINRRRSSDKYLLSLSEILDSLPKQIRPSDATRPIGAFIETGNHALALAYHQSEDSYHFFDPNLGEFRFKNKDECLQGLTKYFKRVKNDYEVTLQNEKVYLETYFITRPLVDTIRDQQMHLIDIGLPMETPEQDNIAVSNQLTAEQRIKALEEALSGTMVDNNLDDNWIPEFSSMSKSKEGKWELSFVNQDEKSTQVKEVVIDPGKFESTLIFLKKQGKKIKDAFAWENGKTKLKPSVSSEIHLSGMEGLNMLALFQMILSSPSDNNELQQRFDTPLTIGLEIFAWANMAQNTLQTSVEIIHTGLSVINEDGPIISKTLSVLSKGSKGLSSAAILFNAFTVGLDAYELDLAIERGDSAAIVGISTSLAFDAASLGLGVSGYIAGGTTGAVAGMLAVPLAGLSIGMTALIDQIEGNFQQCLATAKHFYELGMAYEKGGYYLNETNGVLIPYFGAVIKEIDLENKTITFGKTLIPANRVPQDDPNVISQITSPSTHPKILDLLLDWREAWGANEKIDMKETSNIIMLPVTGNSVIRYSYNSFLTTINLRKDTELVRLDRVFYDTGRKFAFRHWQDIAIQAFQQIYQDTEIKVRMSKTNQRLHMPPYSDYPKDIHHIGGGGFYTKMGNWNMHYILEGNGRTYTLGLNKGARVTISEHPIATMSTWILHVEGKDVMDDITNLQYDYYSSSGSLYVDNIAIEVKFPLQTTILVYKRNGELWHCNLIKGKATLIEVDRSWIEKHLKDLRNSLSLLAENNNVEQIFLSDIPPNVETTEVTKLAGVFIASTQQILAEDVDYGFIYELNEHFLPSAENVCGVSATWKEKYVDYPGSERNFNNELENLAKSYHKKILHLWRINLEINHKWVSVFQYSSANKLLVGMSREGKVYHIDQKNNLRLVAFNRELHDNFERNKLGKMTGPLSLSPASSNTTETFNTLLEKQKSWVYDFKNLLNDENISNIITLYGIRNTYNVERIPESRLQMWYDTTSEQFIVAGGLSNSTLQYVGYQNELAWLFDQKEGRLYAQVPLGKGTDNLFDFAPLAIQPFHLIGNLKSVEQNNGQLVISSLDDMIFTVNSLVDITLVKKGDQCPFSLNSIEDRAKLGYYQLADMLYVYDPPYNSWCKSCNSYWYYSPLRLKFHPSTLTDDSSLTDYAYIGYSSKNNGICLFNKKKERLYFISANGSQLSTVAKNVIRVGNTLGIEGLLISRTSDFYSNPFMLPIINDIKTVMLRFSSDNFYLMGINWADKTSFTRVIVRIANEDIYEQVPYHLIIAIKGVTIEEFGDNFRSKLNGNDTAVTNGIKSIVFEGGLPRDINEHWMFEFASPDYRTFPTVRVIDALKNSRTKRSLTSKPVDDPKPLIEKNVSIFDFWKSWSPPISNNSVGWISNPWFNNQLTNNNESNYYSEKPGVFSANGSSLTRIDDVDITSALQLITVGILKLTGHQLPHFKEKNTLSEIEARIYFMTIADEINVVLREAGKQVGIPMRNLGDEQEWRLNQDLKKKLYSTFIQGESFEKVILLYMDNIYSKKLTLTEKKEILQNAELYLRKFNGK